MPTPEDVIIQVELRIDQAKKNIEELERRVGGGMRRMGTEVAGAATALRSALAPLAAITGAMAAIAGTAALVDRGFRAAAAAARIFSTDAVTAMQGTSSLLQRLPGVTGAADLINLQRSGRMGALASQAMDLGRGVLGFHPTGRAFLMASEAEAAIQFQLRDIELERSQRPGLMRMRGGMNRALARMQGDVFGARTIGFLSEREAIMAETDIARSRALEAGASPRELARLQAFGQQRLATQAAQFALDTRMALISAGRAVETRPTALGAFQTFGNISGQGGMGVGSILELMRAAIRSLQNIEQGLLTGNN